MTDRLHPTFRLACADIAALGHQVSAGVLPGATRYVRLGGRSNARWWLIPLATRRSAASGFGLFQPQLPSARVMKALAIVFTWCGLSILARRSSGWSVAGQSALAPYFPETVRPVFAYFTGTDGPHRKITVQVMDERGKILGYAKSSSDGVVRKLIAREGEALEQLNRLEFRTAQIPCVRFAGEVNGAYVLATDSRKTFWSVSERTYGTAHHAFLQELFQKTRQRDATASGCASALSESWQPLLRRLEVAWQQRIAASLNALERHGETSMPTCMAHGDFTPWNTFSVGDKLYVFDWEYADAHAPAGGDAIHFVHSQPHMWRADPRDRIAASQASLRLLHPDASADSIHAMHLVYALMQALRVVEKMALQPGAISHWDGADSQAALMDQLVATP